MKLSDILAITGIGAGVGTSIYAANKASGSIQDASARSTALDKEIFDWQKANLAPYQNAGVQSLNALTYGLGLTGGPTTQQQNVLANPGDLSNYQQIDTLGNNGQYPIYALPEPSNSAELQSDDFGLALLRRQQELIQTYGMTPQEAGAQAMAESGQFQKMKGGGLFGKIAGALGGPITGGFAGALASGANAFNPGGGSQINTQWANPNIAQGQAGGQPGGQPGQYGGVGFGEFNAPFNFEKAPGYDFRLNEGLNSIEKGAAARTGLLSGNTLKSLQDYAQNYASNEFQDAFNRFQVDRGNRFNQFSTVAGLGQTATQQANALGSSYGNAFGNNALTAGSAQAGGILGTAGAINQGIGTGINLLQQRQMANSLAFQNQGNTGGIPILGDDRIQDNPRYPILSPPPPRGPRYA